MKRLLAATIMALLPVGGQAQTAQELAKGASDQNNVLNYGMGYHLQRFSPIGQINKNNVKDLVPVWNYAYDDNRSEESQPLVYNSVPYVTTRLRPRASSAAASSTVVLPSLTARSTARRSTPMSSHWMPKPVKRYGSKTQ